MCVAKEGLGYNDNKESNRSMTETALQAELERLKQMLDIGYEVKVAWIPGAVRHCQGKKLAEEVKGDYILIYAENEEMVLELLRHGFAEWILNEHTKHYRQFINALITLFEEQHYERKEKIVTALTKMMKDPSDQTKYKKKPQHNSGLGVPGCQLSKNRVRG